MVSQELKNRKRQDYGYHLEYRTRWSDNDMYDHMNNSIYNFLYDSIVNTYLIEQCGLHPPSSSQYGLVVHSHGDFFGSIAFPATAELALRVNKLGKSSVTYEIALFERGVEEVKSVGEFVHVFVDRKTGRPAAAGMNGELKTGLQKLLVPQSKL
ncbi:thioesterase superfamily protein-like protein [Bisporella sp. PMI_857]|nr:thioesterase superfamily protein-like protein [Bisporella sp. PMI_857]